MTPQEIAMKFASASATCKNGNRCPYSSECKGTGDTCKMKEVAMIIRSLLEELSIYRAKYKTLEGLTAVLCDYVRDLEQINEDYYRLCVAFQNGYRTKSRVKRKRRKHIPRKNIPVEQMDGDERYAYEEPKEPKPDLPVVII